MKQRNKNCRMSKTVASDCNLGGPGGSDNCD